MHAEPARPLMSRRTWTGLAAAVAVIILGVFGIAAPVNAASTRVQPRHPARVATGVSNHYCTLSLGGGIVTTQIIVNTSDGYWGTLTVKTTNTSVPRRVYFDRDAIIDGNGSVWRGEVGSIPAGGSADPWTAWNVWLPNVVFTYAMHDARGNKDWRTCGV